MEVPSPTNVHVATVEVDNCTPSHQQQMIVFLSSAGSTTSVFVAPSSVLQSGETYSLLPLRISWVGDDQLEIAYPRGTKLQSDPNFVRGVHVTYKEFAPYAP